MKNYIIISDVRVNAASSIKNSWPKAALSVLKIVDFANEQRDDVSFGSTDLHKLLYSKTMLDRNVFLLRKLPRMTGDVRVFLLVHPTMNYLIDRLNEINTSENGFAFDELEGISSELDETFGPGFSARVKSNPHRFCFVICKDGVMGMKIGKTFKLPNRDELEDFTFNPSQITLLKS